VYSGVGHLTWRVRVVGGPADPDRPPYNVSFALRKHGGPRWTRTTHLRGRAGPFTTCR